ncbi:chorismate lyase [Shewanella sp. Isolate11]|uniref:chorismate--pyruvate lyase family protein n=1 Tax=Shewanella sp. Isolate11 TaxID=2908530 RepID=UPI001EFEBCB6|nr:chorismate lyase [Shewanella sp. Isolate11]MCG9698390.1 chorismate lyase [Shewanella sp. Isolate11]
MSVTRLSFPYGESIQWFSPNNIPLQPTSPFKDWLLDTGSLTQKLKSHCQQFEVIVLGEDKLSPFKEEFPTHDSAWVREVLLCLDGTPWVFARTLIPSDLLDNSEFNFIGLGNRPLGELLFTEGEFTPGKIEVSHFTPCQSLAALIQAQGQSSQPVWGRRRYFNRQDKHLIVSEIFLPAARQLIESQQLK